MTRRLILLTNMKFHNWQNAASFLLALVLIIGTTEVSWAVESPRAQAAASVAAEAQATRIANLKSRADTEIQRRIASLNTLITKLNANKRLSSSQKVTFVDGINAEISSLNSLKTKIDNDTDVATLKTDVQSIVTSYRVYLLYVPQIHILAADDAIRTAADKLTSLAAELNTRIQQDKDSASGISSVENSYNDMLSQIAAARTQATNADNLVLNLQPSGYPGNRPQLLEAQKDVVAGKKNLVAALQDGKSIVQALRAVEKSSGATNSASPTNR